MKSKKILSKGSCMDDYGYRPTNEQIVILNDTDAMRELLIKIWGSTKEVSRVYN